MKNRFNQFLVDSNLIFQALASNTNDYIYIWDFNRGDYIVSPNFAEDFDIDREGEDFISVWHTFIHERDLERVKDVIQEAVKTRKNSLKIEYQVINSRGSYVWLSDKSTIHYGEKNTTPNLMIGVMHNLMFDGRIDSTTGLLMHNKCKEIFELLQSSKLENYGSLMLLGIDEFANINTLYSHTFGDMVLRTTAQDILKLLSDNVSMYRYDGDQLLVIAEKKTKAEMIRLYNDIKEYTAISREIQGRSYRFTVSAGIAEYPQDGVTWAELEKAVSVALKKAKEMGKNHYVVFTNEMLEKRLYEQSLGQYLADSIEHNFTGFKVVFQPVCRAKDLKVKGAEILLRFEFADRTLVSPNEFIPLLEQSQLIIPVGMWVMEKAIQICKQWTRYQKDFVMNVNVSYIQLRDITFCDKVEALLKKYELNVRHIVIELTESYFITDARNINISMRRLKDMHLQIAMDDFGTGYSSLARLAEFNVDVVKIDRTFVQSVHQSKYNRDFVDSVVRLCHNVGMQVCVEGVETKEEQESICVLNADFIQGFYVSQPIDEEQFLNTFLVDPDINESLVVVPNIQLRQEQLVGDKDVLSAMMDATPLALNFWNSKLEIIACNVEALALFEAESFEELSANFYQFSPEKQADGQLSEEKVKQVLNKAFEGERVKIFWQHCKRNGEMIPSEVTLVRIPYMKEYIVASYTRDMRGQRALEGKIQKFNTRLRAILDASPLCLNLWNKQFQNILCNKAAVSLFELESEQDYLERFSELSPEYQRDGSLSSEKASQYITQAFTTGRVQFEWLHQKFNGEQIPAEITLVKIDELDEDGSELVAGYTRDMREQREMEKKIEKFNNQLQAILDASPLCLNLWNKQYENIMCNKAAVELFELTNEQEYLDRFFELSPEYQPDGSLSSEKATMYIEEAFENGKAQFQWVHRKLDGEEIVAEITLVKVEGLDEDGELGELVAGYTRDIRSQLEAEKLQQIIIMRIRAVMDSSPLACILWSSDLQVIDCNKVAVQMLGVEDKNEIIRDFERFIPPKQPDGEDSIIKKNQKFDEVLEKNSIIFEWVYLNKRNEKVPCEVSLVKVPLEKEEIIIAYSRDLRELYQTLELNERLSKMAYFDLLTGVASRARFVEKLEENFSTFSANSDFALALFDIDCFKTINDTYGHEAGDVVLKRVSRFVEKMLPQSATLGRLGGDEFIIQIKDINKTELQCLMEKIVKNVAELVFTYNDTTFTTAISMGASFKTAEDEDCQQLINRADKALYKAKDNGRNCSFIL